jgi:Flp pilus assembly protein TadD
MYLHRFPELLSGAWAAPGPALETPPDPDHGKVGAHDLVTEEVHALRHLFRISPDRIGVRARLGILSFERGRFDEAEFHLRWVCERDPRHGEAHLYRGEALHRLGKTDEALPILERARELDPGNARTHYLLGILYAGRERTEEAEENYRRARQLWNS